MSQAEFKCGGLGLRNKPRTWDEGIRLWIQESSAKARWRCQCQNPGSLSEGTEAFHKTPLRSDFLGQIQRHHLEGSEKEGYTYYLQPYWRLHATVAFLYLTSPYLKMQHKPPGPALLITIYFKAFRLYLKGSCWYLVWL